MEEMKPKKLRTSFSAWGIVILMALGMGVTPEASAETGECEELMEEIANSLPEVEEQQLDEFLASCEPCDWPRIKDVCEAVEVDTDPEVEAHLSATFSNCEGVREHIKEHEVTVAGGGGAVVAGKVAAVFGFVTASYTQESKGWSWSFTCDLTVDHLYAKGDGSVDREVAIRGTTHGDTRTEASCVYLEGGCETRSIMEGTWTIEYKSDGVTDGYPTKASAEVAAYAVNKPADREPICPNHHTCLNQPSIGAIIDGRTVKHAPAWSESDGISWEEAGLGIGELIGDLDPDPVSSPL